MTNNGHKADGVKIHNSKVRHQFDYGGEEVPQFVCAPGCPVAELDRQSGTLTSGVPCGVQNDRGTFHQSEPGFPVTGYGDTGGASRFFPCFEWEERDDWFPFRYEAKPSTAERNDGCGDLDDRIRNRVNPGGLEHDPKWGPIAAKNHHATVKPVPLLQWLIRLAIPPGGRIIEPFAGSGSTGVAALREGRSIVLIEKEAEYIEIIRARVGNAERVEREMRPRKPEKEPKKRLQGSLWQMEESG